ncbi:hypothetical protein ACF0H5_006371 [Mactra antiquata]
MPSMWKYICCDCCDIADNTRTRGNSSYKRYKPNKNTWTRRKLLEAEDDTNNEKSAQEMRTITATPIRGLDDDDDNFEERILDHFAPKKRPAIHDVFDTAQKQESDGPKTTFPWMDDRFVPNGRSRTRLGISSVQINSKRTEIRNNLFNEYNNGKDTSDHVDNAVVVKQQQVAANRQVYRNNYQLNLNQTNLKQNGQVIRNNIVTAPKSTPAKQNHVRHVVNINNNNRPMIYKESSSDVGVRRVNSHVHQVRQNRIPKLEDYSNLNVKHYKDSSSDIGHNRQRSQGGYHKIYGGNDGDVSFSSEVTFRPNPSRDVSRNVSFKSSPEPLIVSSKGSKYERLKSGNIKLKAKKDKSIAESMYGYVPKAVQEVQASNALEGTQIDDYFMKLFQDRQMEKFGLLENAENVSRDLPVIVASVCNSRENLTQDDTGTKGIQPLDTVDNKHVMSKLSSVPNTTATISSPAKVDTMNDLGADTKPLNITVNGNANTCTNNVKVTPEVDDKIIMIDFPPNPDNDKKYIVRNVKPNQAKPIPPPNIVVKQNNNTVTRCDEVLY